MCQSAVILYEEICDGFNRSGTHLCNLIEDGVKGAGLQRVVEWNGEEMNRWAVMA